MTEAEYGWYTKTDSSSDGGRRIAEMAKEITHGIDNYWEKIYAVYTYLKFGDYRYSLKPGIAPSGDQLSWFLFDVKKGYCSYFAFAFTSLLRSLGIPSRVAVGFFFDPEEERLSFYPVRANMAHAWVEVYFGEYGWIEWDPTTEKLADGEEFVFSSGGGEVFERLLKEILDTRAGMKIKNETDDEEIAASSFRETTVRVLKKYAPFFFAGVIAFFIIFIKSGNYIAAKIFRNPRKKAVFLWKHIFNRFRKILKTGNVETSRPPPFDGLYAVYQAARFAPSFTVEEYRAMFALYKKAAAAFAAQRPSVKQKLPLVSKQKLLLLLLLTFLHSSGGSQDAASAADSLYREALNAENAENYERAVALFSQGKNEHPFDTRFPFALGNLYYNNALYHLAWDEYQDAERLAGNSVDLLYQIAQTAGFLNKNNVSAAYLERILAIDENNRNATGSLGWMYFKLHRLNEGAALLSSALENGAEPDFSMTLATIYSDLYNYEESKKNYLLAIKNSSLFGASDFTAVALYNLSILESRFYNYDAAEKAVGESLAASDRASGHLAAGELFFRMLDFPALFAEYTRAYEIDNSPLAKISLAEAYQNAGRLDEALLYAENTLASSNLSWMLNYGIDVDQYKRDLHEILYKTYTALANREKFIPYAGVKENIKKIYRIAAYAWKGTLHKKRYQKYALSSAASYNVKNKSAPVPLSGSETGGFEPHLDALLQYSYAFEDYRRRSLTYLEAARIWEVARIPRSEARYNYLKGKLISDKGLLEEALSRFDGVWERDLTAETCAAAFLLIPLSGNEAKQSIAGRLYALNRGALLQNSIPLPVDIRVEAAALPTAAVLPKAANKAAARLTRLLHKAGFAAAPQGRYSLNITLYSGGARCVLFDNLIGATLADKSFAVEKYDAAGLCLLTRSLQEALFTER
jgi:tetratricopeptide (TPR) repeat protein